MLVSPPPGPHPLHPSPFPPHVFERAAPNGPAMAATTAGGGRQWQAASLQLHYSKHAAQPWRQPFRAPRMRGVCHPPPARTHPPTSGRSVV